MSTKHFMLGKLHTLGNSIVNIFIIDEGEVTFK
jgi:hypothetical protein